MSLSNSMSVPKASLSAIVSLAGTTQNLDRMDDESASRVIRVLFGRHREGLNEILLARSISELTPTQNDMLQEVIHIAARRLEMSEKPIN